MRLRARIGWLAACGLVILAAIGGAVGSQFAEATAAENEYLTQLQPAAAAADQLAIAIADMDRGLSDFLLTGKPADRVAYDGAAAQGAAALRALGDSAGVVSIALTAWKRDVAIPAIEAATAGRPAAALAAYDSPRADQQYLITSRAAGELQETIDGRELAQVGTVTQASRRLLLAVISSLVLLLLGLVLAFVLLNSWVVRPIESLRVQLRRVTGEREHEAPIVPDGPPEIAALGRDAEQMRRELVAETDEARAALEGLAQEGPTVTLVRAALDRPEELATSTATVFGRQYPAEGMLAGDWWDAVELGDGSMVIALCDVAGHGPAAAVVGLQLKALAMNALAGGDFRRLDLAAAAAALTSVSDVTATCLIVVIDPGGNRLHWINAGHPPGQVLRGAGGDASLAPTGPLLSGLGGHWAWRSLPLEGDEVLLLWSDGLTESSDPTNEVTAARVVQLARVAMSRSSGGGAREIGEILLARMRALSVDWQRDDVTLVVAEFESR